MQRHSSIKWDLSIHTLFVATACEVVKTSLMLSLGQ